MPAARTVAGALLAGVLTTLLTTVLTAPPVAAGAPPRGTDVVTRAVVFEVENTNATRVACVPDGGSYRVRGELVGPRASVLGASTDRINVLVHDFTTASWFWHLSGHPSYDYATQLARRGETSLVIDRLGYESSRLADGNATCLGAQADMLHQIVQHLRSGRYDFRGSTTRGTPAAHHVVVHGHSAGAAIAELEAATFDDVDGLVLMSWTDAGASTRAVDEASRQSALCLQGQDYAAYGQSGKDFRELLFATAPARIQEVATRRRNDAPCGDALSVAQMLAAAALTTRTIEAPVLLLFGGQDALNRPDARSQQVAAFDSSVAVTHHTVAGAGSALPLEKSARGTRARVIRWLRATLG